MTYEQRSDTDYKQKEAIWHEVDTRIVEELLARYDPHIIMAAAAVLNQLPRPVSNGETIEWGAEGEQIRRELGRLSANRFED